MTILKLKMNVKKKTRSESLPIMHSWQLLVVGRFLNLQNLEGISHFTEGVFITNVVIIKLLDMTPDPLYSPSVHCRHLLVIVIYHFCKEKLT